MTRSTVFAAFVLAALAACDGAAVPDDSAAAPTASSEEAVTCQQTSLTSSTCAGPWEYHQSCDKADAQCGENPNGACTAGKTCDIVTGSTDVTASRNYNVGVVCIPQPKGHPPHCGPGDTTQANASCAALMDSTIADVKAGIADADAPMRALVTGQHYGTITNNSPTSTLPRNYECHVTVHRPVFHMGPDINACGCAHHEFNVCTVPPQKCENPPLRYSRSGMTYAQIESESLDPQAVCLTGDTLSAYNPGALYDRLRQTWDRLGIVDGSFEDQENRTPVAPPWFPNGSVGIDIDRGYAVDGWNNGFLAPGPGEWADLHQTIIVVPGQTYTIQGYLKADANIPTVYFGVRYAGRSGTYKESTFTKTQAAGAWVSVWFTAPANTYMMDFYVGLYADSAAGHWVQLDNLSILPQGGVYAESLHQLVAQKMRALYDLHGGQLTPDRLAGARAIGFDNPGAERLPLTCGDPDSLPAPTPCGGNEQTYARMNEEFQRCSMLVSSSVDVRLASRELAGCIIELGYLNDQLFPEEMGTATDLACNGPAIRDAASKIIVNLLHREFDVMTAAGAAPGDTELATLAGLGRQLALIDMWYRDAIENSAHGGLGEDVVLDQLSYVLRGFWDAVYRMKNPFQAVRAALADTSHPATSDTLTPLLHDLTQNAFSVEKDVLTAAFTPMDKIPYDNLVLNRAPLAGAPLLVVLSDGLEALATRVDDMSVYHDFGCTFRTDCQTAKSKTPIASTWKLLATLGNKADLTSALTDVPALSGWRDVFTTIKDHYEQLAASLPAAGLGAGDPQALPRAQRGLAVIVRNAQQHSASFERTGQFDPIAPHSLSFGVDVDQRNAIINEVRNGYTTFAGAVSTYNHDLATTLGQLVADVDTQASAQHLLDEKLRLATQYDALAEDAAGLANANDKDQADFADIVKRFDTVRGSIDSGVYVPKQTITHLNFTGDSARTQGGGGTPNNMGGWHAPKIENLEAGNMVQLEVTGDYIPSCSLQHIQLLSPIDGQPGFAASAATAVSGPEGYAITWNNSAYQAYAHSVGGTESAKAGMSVTFCAGTPGVVSTVTGVDAKGCAYASYDYTKSWSSSNNDGSQNNLSASFSGGLRLPNTPFPTMPAGALLLIFADRTSGAIREAHVLERGNNAFVVPTGNLTGHLVVNDGALCGTSYDSSRPVGLDGHVMQDQVSASRPLLSRMGLVLARMRSLEQTVVDQGRILPSQSAAARSDAMSLLDATSIDPSGNPVPGPSQDNIPPAVHRLFEAFVDNEILRTERLVELKQIGREQKLIQLEMRNLVDDANLGAEKSRLQALVTRWTARNLDSTKLRLDAVSLLHLTRSYFLPILEIWYPSAVTAFANLPQVNAVLDADITTSVPDMANMVNDALGVLYTKFGDATRGQKLPAEEYPWVAISIPNPYYAQQHDYGYTAWARSEATEAYSVWDAIHQRRKGRITIRPEDIYGAGDFRLDCKRHNPVIQKMGLYVVRPGEPDYPELNSPQRDFEAVADMTEVFAQTEGPVTWTLESDEYNSFEIPIIYGEALQMVANVRPKLATQQSVGLSPFTSFDVDFSEISAIENGDPGSGFTDEFASELVVVMQIDSRGTSTKLPWIRSCH